MNRMDTANIPRDPLDIRYNNTGELLHVGLHRKGDLWFHESSYSHFWFAGTMFLVAIVFAFLPWDSVWAAGIKSKYFFVAMFAWGGICGLIPYFIRNAAAHTIVIDPVNQTVSIRNSRDSDFPEPIHWRDIIGVQVCHQKAPGDSEMDGYQLNLVWRDSHGNVKRHCLLKHVIKKLVVSLGRRYESLFQFPYLDHLELPAKPN